jgi:hypothetical protein
LIALVFTAPILAGQELSWQTRAVLYGDNTEFFTPYRIGETILGGQLTTWLDARPSRRTSLQIGVFADRRSGSGAFTDSIKPVLSARYQTQHSLGVMGTLASERRHGLGDVIMVSTRELTTPIEYGLQWRETRNRVTGESWINWRRLNTEEHREEFELGAVLAVRAREWLTLEAQHLWSHRGGQLHEAGVPVTNNRVTGVGATVRHVVGPLGELKLSAFQYWSAGHLIPDPPVTAAANGKGTLLRASIAPWQKFEFFGIYWTGRDFHAAAGDANYGSLGKRDDFYRAERRYRELGALYRHGSERGPELDADIRWHKIDNESSIAFFGTSWELSFRLVARMPISVRLRR